MSDKELELTKIGKKGRVEKWRLVPSGIGNAANSLTLKYIGGVRRGRRTRKRHSYHGQWRALSICAVWC